MGTTAIVLSIAFLVIYGFKVGLYLLNMIANLVKGAVFIALFFVILGMLALSI